MFQRTEYTREEDKNRDQEGGWRSWFGLGDKKNDDDYHYKSTTTYRGDANRDFGTPSRDTYRERETYRPANINVNDRYTTDRYTTGGDYPRGGYGYQTSGDAYSRGGYQSTTDYNRFNTDRDVRPYGQTYGGERDYNTNTSRTYVRDSDRDTQPQGYYRSETRTYGGVGDRDYNTRPSYGQHDTSYSRQQYGGHCDTPSRQFGGECSTRYPMSGDYNRTHTGTGYGPSTTYDRDNTRGGYSYNNTSRW